MEEFSQEDDMTQQENRDRWAEIRAQVNRPLFAAAVALFVILAITAGYGLHQRALVQDLTAQSAATSQSMAQLQNQVNSLHAQIQGMTQASQAQTQAQSQAQSAEPADETAPEAPVQAAAMTPPVVAPATKTEARHAGPRRRALKHNAAADKRYEQLQSQLTEQQKELQDTQQQVEKYRSDLQGNIDSTRTELTGAIAKNHDELVLLEKKGERSYYEFELTKSKQFERVGPLSLSLRKADTKHKSYDLAMLVDDNQLSKKKINLYEPVTIHTDNASQPVQIIVNHIDKNLVHGYVSAPKYRPSELTPANAAAAATPTTNISSSTQEPAANSKSQQQ
jgi:cell division protein FtsB